MLIVWRRMGWHVMKAKGITKGELMQSYMKVGKEKV